MKMEQFHVGQLVGFGGGECVIERITRNWIKLVGHDIAVDPTALTPLEPKVGDTIRVVAISRHDKHPSHRVGEEAVVDDEFRRTNEAGDVQRDGDWCYLSCANDGAGTWCRVVLLRRASPPAEVKEADRLFKGDCCTFCGARGNDVVHYIGHKSDPRPYNVCRYPKHADEPWWGSCGKEYERRKSLQPAPTSAGEAVAAGWVPRSGEHVEGEHWNDCGKTLRGAFLYFDDEGDAQCKSLDGTGECTIKRRGLKPISPPPAGSALNGDAQASASEPVGGGSLKPDPVPSLCQLCPDCHAQIELNGPERCTYCAHRELEEAGRPPVNPQWAHHDRMRALAYLGHEDDALNRLAATRRAKLAQTKEAMDRPAVERHPAPSSMASSRGVVFGPLGEKQFHRSARRHWKRDEGHPSNWPSMPDVEEL
ncbi:MAG TPA: hypothetical protein VGK73_14765 [Polyangiaceae bacterium]